MPARINTALPSTRGMLFLATAKMSSSLFCILHSRKETLWKGTLARPSTAPLSRSPGCPLLLGRLPALCFFCHLPCLCVDLFRQLGQFVIRLFFFL